MGGLQQGAQFTHGDLRQVFRRFQRCDVLVDHLLHKGDLVPGLRVVGGLIHVGAVEHLPAVLLIVAPPLIGGHAEQQLLQGSFRVVPCGIQLGEHLHGITTGKAHEPRGVHPGAELRAPVVCGACFGQDHLRGFQGRCELADIAERVHGGPARVALPMGPVDRFLCGGAAQHYNKRGGRAEKDLAGVSHQVLPQPLDRPGIGPKFAIHAGPYTLRGHWFNVRLFISGRSVRAT